MFYKSIRSGLDICIKWLGTKRGIRISTSLVWMSRLTRWFWFSLVKPKTESKTENSQISGEVRFNCFLKALKGQRADWMTCVCVCGQVVFDDLWQILRFSMQTVRRALLTMHEVFMFSCCLSTEGYLLTVQLSYHQVQSNIIWVNGVDQYSSTCLDDPSK